VFRRVIDPFQITVKRGTFPTTRQGGFWFTKGGLILLTSDTEFF